MIFCLGSVADPTFCHTLAALKGAGADFDVVDFAQLTLAGDVEAPLDDPAQTLLSLHGARYRLGRYRSAYLRMVDISDAAPSPELRERAAGLYQALSRLFTDGPLPVVNPPLRDVSNFSKVYHAVSLAPLGAWRIPRSCLTNSREEALEFIGSCPRGAIFKGASAAKTWATLFDPGEHGPRLERLPSCPVLFQERITGPDVRVHVVGGNCFAESITCARVDYRSTRNNEYRPIDLPLSIDEGCRTLCQRRAIPFLGIDFKIDADSGEWFFLEANSMPCYEGYDRRRGGAISRALAAWLMDGGSDSAARP
jgi:hypothetical protein